MSVSQDPHTSKAKSFHIEEYKIFLKVLLSTTAVASPNMLAAVGQDVYVCLLLSFSSYCFLQEAKSAITVISNSVVEVQSTIHYY
jgi:hypothetical protein